MSTEADRAAVRLFRAVQIAFSEGDFDALRVALRSERWFNEPVPAEIGGDYPLKLAIDWSPISFIARMIDAGSDPNQPDDSGFTGIIAALAARRPEHLEIMQLLIQRGADPNGRGVHNWTPLHYAAVTKNPEAVSLLLASGADPDLSCYVDVASRPIDLARAYGCHDCIGLLEAATSNKGR